MSIENLIDSIEANDSGSSLNAFKDLMNAKITAAIETKKIELANSVYNGEINQEEEIE